MTTKYNSERRLFYIKDLIVYLVALLVIIGLFLGFIIFPKTNSSFKGFNVSVKGDIILTCYADGQIVIAQNYLENVEYFTSENVITIKILSLTHHDGYNQIEINTKEKTAKVVESNCSNSKDCVFSPKISTSGAIYCAPHGLKISAIGDSPFIPPTVG